MFSLVINNNFDVTKYKEVWNFDRIFIFHTAQPLIEECVTICVEKQDEYGNFWNFIDYIRPLILKLESGCMFSDPDEVSTFLWRIINILWENRMPQLLLEFLTGQEFKVFMMNEKIKSKLKLLLMKSCRHEADFNSPMVKVLITYDQRLTLSTQSNK